MCLRPVIIVLLLTAALVLSGILLIPEGAEGHPGDLRTDAGAEDPRDLDDKDDGSGDENGSGIHDEYGPGAGGAPHEGGTGKNTSTAEEDMECHEHDLPQPAHPDNHSVSSEDELLCPGHYLIHEEGSGESWEVPTWEVGDWWYYEHESYAGAGTQCSYHSKETVIADDGEILGVPVYTIEIKLYDCDGEEYDQDPNTENRSQHSLMTIKDDGFVNHHLIFPLVEGKSWTYVANSCPEGECDQIDVDEVSHEEVGGILGTLEVCGLFGPPDIWTSQWSIDSEQGTVEVDQQWSVKHKALQYEEYNHEAIAGPILTKELLDSSHRDGTSNLVCGPL